MKPMLERGVWTAALAMTMTTVVAWRAATPEPLPFREAIASVPFTGVLNDADGMGAQVQRVVTGDPFRLDRVPSATPYRNVDFPGTAAAVVLVDRPDLRLIGVLGPPWRAVLEGVPGRDGGVLVAVGDTLVGLRVQAIRAFEVVFRTPDTSWTLTLRRTW